MNLYVIRHAIAVEPGTPGYAEDSRRPLTDKGRQKMESIARGLRGLDVELEMIVSSPYVRARQTAAILSDVYGMRSEPLISDNLAPGGDLGGLIGEIDENYLAENLALVGHEPGCSAFISKLLAGHERLLFNMKKGSVCCLRLERLRPQGGATLEWLMSPAQLAKLGA